MERNSHHVALWQSTVIAGVAAIVGNLILWWIFKPLTLVPETFKPLVPSSIITFTIFGTIGAAIAFMIIRKFSSRPERTFLTIACIVLLLSFIPDFLIRHSTSPVFIGATSSAIALLMLMHSLSAFIIIEILTKLTRKP